MIKHDLKLFIKQEATKKTRQEKMNINIKANLDPKQITQVPEN